MRRIQEFLNRYESRLEYEANNIRSTAMPKLTEEQFALFEQTGNRLIFEAAYFERRKYLVVFGMMSVLYQRDEDIKKLEEIITDICSEECWALPAHVNRNDNPDWKICIDLFAAETAQTIAEYISSLTAFIFPHLYDLAKTEIFRRVLNPFYEKAAPYGNWEFCDNNWCAVCSGAIGSASLYLMQDKPEYLAQCIQRIRNSLEHYISGFSLDGACMEGLGYFTYGMTYFTGFAEQLRRYTNNAVDLMDDKRCALIAEFQQKCFFTGGRTLSFSDGDSRDHFKMGLTSYLAMRYPSVLIPDMSFAAEFDSDKCYRSMAVYRDYYWTKEYLSKLNDGSITHRDNSYTTGQTVLQSAEWSICRSRNGVAFAAKGGHNDEPHNHNDVGSFLYIAGGEMFLSDLGAGEYTKEYFGQQRYSILCNSSLGHNVPLINNEQQLPGKNHANSLFKADGHGNTVINFTDAYEKGLIKSITRTLHFDTDTGLLKIEDCFVPSERTNTVTENLVTQFTPEIEGNKILLKGQAHDCVIRVESETQISYSKKQHMDHDGNPVDIYLIQWDVPLLGSDFKSVFAVESDLNKR